MADKVTKKKGDKNGLCNRTDCQSPHNVVWFNHGTRKYYCTRCADWLNTDPYNHRDAHEMYGHDLCTKDAEVTKEDIRVFRTVRRIKGDEVTMKPVKTLEAATECFENGARLVACEKPKARKEGSNAPEVLVSRTCVSLEDAQNFFTGTTEAASRRMNAEQQEWQRRSKNSSLAASEEIPKSQR
jgi:hypothetical protein